MNRGIGDLDGKVAVVTGAAGAIGRSVAIALAQAGARVCAADINQEAVEAVAAELPGGPHRAEAIDLRELDAHERLLRGAAAELGGVDVLANLAAVLIRRNHVDEITEADWDLQHDLNLKAAFFLNRAAGQLMCKQGRGGRLINFSSQGWWSGGFGGSVVYAATKGGIVSMCRGLARTYAKDGITVNSVAPGAVDTPMLRSGLTPEQLHDQTVQIPMGYMAAPDDLAGAVVFLASDAARYLTGTTINVSGGWLMY
jgi:NAD(P)-dependent dehydrogenase (short-subunit alcohol dehydrogenase family)